MPYMKLGKKLLLAKKAWKGFTSTLQTKLGKLKRSKSIKKAKTHLNSTLSAILRRRRRRLSPPPRSKPTRSRLQAHPTAHHAHKGFAPVFVDELFKKPASAPPVVEHVREYCSPSTSKVVVGRTASSTPPPANGGVKIPLAKAEKFDAAGRPPSATAKPVTVAAPRAFPGTATSSSTAEVAADHELWGVDARAEQFILQFKEEMRLQRLKSFREYQEMLARGAM